MIVITSWGGIELISENVEDRELLNSLKAVCGDVAEDSYEDGDISLTRVRDLEKTEWGKKHLETNVRRYKSCHGTLDGKARDVKGYELILDFGR